MHFKRSHGIRLRLKENDSRIQSFQDTDIKLKTLFNIFPFIEIFFGNNIFRNIIFGNEKYIQL